MTISICAVIAARNEAPYLRILLPVLESQGIDVVIIDNDSNDQSHDIYAKHSPHPIVHIEHLPYNGKMSLIDILSTKREIYKNLSHDWVIHHDADEILDHYKEGLTLRDAIQEADDAGYNVLNFDEFVFLPEANSDYRGENYYHNILHYYFFKPVETNRLQRVWKRSKLFSNLHSGGHTLMEKDLATYPANHILRHYIVLGYEHAKIKYLDRKFCQEDLNKHWHGNRMNFTVNNLRLPRFSPHIYKLSHHSSKEFYKENPTEKHFWQ